MLSISQTYRHYDRLGFAPLLPFGVGLSYTTLAPSDLTLDDARFAAVAFADGKLKQIPIHCQDHVSFFLQSGSINHD